MIYNINSDSKKLTGLHPAIHTVFSNEDLLTEILERLPIISLFKAKLVSKQWLNLINDPHFTLRLAQRPKPDPAFALFIRRITLEPDGVLKYLGYDSISFKTSRIRATNFYLDDSSRSDGFRIMQSCNGLLLVSVGENHMHFEKQIYVCNPTTNMFKRLFSCDNGSLRILFDPRKSLGYKVFHAEEIDEFLLTVRVYFSETREWRVYDEVYPAKCFVGFWSGVYWNDAIYWVNIEYEEPPTHYKLSYVNGHPVLTQVQLPKLHWMLHFDVRLFATGGSLFLLCWDYEHENLLGIYEMKNGCSDWLFKCFVDLKDVLLRTCPCWNIRRDVMCIVFGEKEEESFMLIDVDGDVVEYNFKLKTFRTLGEFGSHCSDCCFEFIASFARV